MATPKKTTPKKTTKAVSKSAPKATAKKKGRAGKKKKMPALSPLLVSFVAGALLAVLVFLGVQVATQEEQQSVAQQEIAIKSAKLLQEKPKLPPKKQTPPENRQSKVEKNAASEQTQVKEPVLPEETLSAVNKALEELQGMPYEQGYAPSMNESVSYVDYAILQTMLKLAIPPENMELLEQISLFSGAESYKFQRLRLYLPKGINNFEKSLKNSLALWTQGTTLEKVTAGQWNIYYGNVQTHTIFVSEEKGSSKPATQAFQKFRSPDTPARMVIVIDDLGPSLKTVDRLLALNFPVTLAFWSDTPRTEEGARRAHAKGREIIIHQPMEPIGYPKVDSGEGTLTVGMPTEQIRQMVQSSVSKVPHAVGLNNHMGSKFTQRADKAEVVVKLLAQNRLFLLDSLTHHRSTLFAAGEKEGIQSYRRDVFLDVVATKENALAELRRAEKIALLKGQAIAIGHPLKGTLEALEEWQKTRNMQVELVRLQDL